MGKISLVAQKQINEFNGMEKWRKKANAFGSLLGAWSKTFGSELKRRQKKMLEKELNR